jgi:hypothetical protein
VIDERAFLGDPEYGMSLDAALPSLDAFYRWFMIWMQWS